MERFSDLRKRDDARIEVFCTAKKMKNVNQDVVGENCVKKDSGNVVYVDDEISGSWKHHYQRLLNE